MSNVFNFSGLFLYFTEDRLKQDATSLLFVLIFKDFVRGNPSQANFSLPKIVSQKFVTPFECDTHWICSEYTPENLRGTVADSLKNLLDLHLSFLEAVITDRLSLSSIQIHWNSVIFGSFGNLTNLEKINYENIDFKFDNILKLNSYEFSCIKTSSISYCTKTYLNAVQNGTCHETVLTSIQYLIS